MKNIVLTRIDDRLIHGQVVTAWLKYITADCILIIDNPLSKNQMMARIYKAAAPSNIQLVIKGIEDSIDFLKNDDSHLKTIFILTKTPEILEELKQNGIEIDKIILGGMGANSERKQLIKNVFASSCERDSMERLIERGTEILYQLVPDDRAMTVTKQVLQG